MSNIVGDFINGVYSYGNTGSSMANAVSAGAQKAQMNFNAGQADTAYARDIEMLGMQSAFNSAEAATQREYNKAMWEASTQANRENMSIANLFSAEEAEKNRQFNAQQAELNRQWQERMSNTAYQRAVADMKSAGINPILAAMNGGASVGSGATASGSAASSAMANSGIASSGMASMSSGSAPMASAGNYTGQGNNMSENLAMFGAIASMFGEGISGLATAFSNIGENLDLVGFAGALGEALGGKSGKETAKEIVGNAQGDFEHLTQSLDRTFTGGLIGEFSDMFSQWGRMLRGQTGGGGGHHF